MSMSPHFISGAYPRGDASPSVMQTDRPREGSCDPRDESAEHGLDAGRARRGGDLRADAGGVLAEGRILQYPPDGRADAAGRDPAHAHTRAAPGDSGGDLGLVLGAARRDD